LIRKEPKQAHKLLKQAVPHHQAALQADPRRLRYRKAFCDNCGLLAVTLLALEDHKSAAEAADQLFRSAVDPANDVYNAACLLARCVPLAERDSQLSEAQRKELAQTYANRAMATLRQAVQKGYKDLARMQQDAGLAPLRSREDYQKLQKELEDKTRAEGK
jgi:hypothetical protein